MSSIRVSGNTSGYYDLTVPDVAGTNTIPLNQVVTTDSSGHLTVSGIVQSTRTNYAKVVLNSTAQTSDTYILENTNGKFAITENHGGSTVGSHFYVVPGGNVGIGTNSPNTYFDVHTTEGNGTARGWIGSWGIIGNSYGGNDLTKLNWAGSTPGSRIQGFTGGDQKFEISANSATYFNGGNVGIGTASPGAELEVNGGSTTGTHAQIVTTGSGHNFDMVDASSTARMRNVAGRLHLTADVNNEYANSEIRMLVDNNIKMTINADGHVTMPYQPAFRAYLSTEWTTISAVVNSGWTEQYDRGNNFNQGTFTAPVAGVYNFTVAWDAKDTLSRLSLQKNGGWSGGFRYEPTGIDNASWETHTYSVETDLAANDTVRLYVEGGSGSYPIHMGGGYWGFFAGHLVG